MTRLQPEDLGDEPVTYAIRQEPRYAVWANRIGVTGSLFGAAMGLSVLLGRQRR